MRYPTGCLRKSTGRSLRPDCPNCTGSSSQEDATLDALEVRPDRHRLVEADESFVIAPELGKDIAPATPGPLDVVLDRERLVEGGKRLVLAIEIGENFTSANPLQDETVAGSRAVEGRAKRASPAAFLA
ncbi:hypothetical protein [Bradyrhizobium sp. WSM471]|uniref:hypothetical protein n=1 Tax=Bradyrhizobium sp. WSM471 TaxID=319017 RepID=UPI0012F9DCFB|nr:MULTISPECIES: hypothetical protein [Bradyrhizobium]UFW39012.1 hypothetical protein BcanWSM471_22635 [Bradyrhizobium canariense]